MNPLEKQLRDLYENETVRELMSRDENTSAVVDALLDAFAGYASLGDDDDEAALIANLPSILLDAMDQVDVR